MNDSETTLETLKETVRRFAEDRDWAQYHTPKNLAASIAIEAAEILEHFQWIAPDRTERECLSSEKLEKIGEECADVLAYLLGITDRLGIDLAAAFQEKMKRNAEKYPAERFRGRFGYNDPGLDDRNTPGV